MSDSKDSLQSRIDELRAITDKQATTIEDLTQELVACRLMLNQSLRVTVEDAKEFARLQGHLMKHCGPQRVAGAGLAAWALSALTVLRGQRDAALIEAEEMREDRARTGLTIDSALAGKTRGNDAGLASRMEAIRRMRMANLPFAAPHNSVPGCGCHKCLAGKVNEIGMPIASTMMILCSQCGNKRCPHANDHENACTGSNDSGQQGSAYP